MINKAEEQAQAAKTKLEEQMQSEFAHVAETLTKENSAIAEKVQSDAQSYKENAAAELKKRLAAVEKGSTERISKAVKTVKDRFESYVS